MIELLLSIAAIAAVALLIWAANLFRKPERDPEIEKAEDDFAEEIGSKIEIGPPVGFKVNRQGRLQAESRPRKKLDN